MRPSKRTLLIFALVLACGTAIWWRLSATHPFGKKTPLAQAPLPVAFLQVRWGMSPAQVETADRVQLRPYESPRRLYRMNDKIKDSSRYKTLQADLPDFLGKPAVAAYVFFDGRLYLYSVSIEGDDAVDLNDRLKPYLVNRFGDRFMAPKDSPRLKAIWMRPDMIVNYWSFLDDQRLHPKYMAVFSVEYRPLSDAIDRLTA